MSRKFSVYRNPLWQVLLLTWLFFINGAVAADDKGYEALRPALALYKLGNYTAAAENWLAVAAELQKKSVGQDVNALKQAGLASVAATIAFNKASDARGYTSWAQAIQYFLQGQTQWEEERDKLRRQLKDITYALKTVSADAGKPPVSGDELLLLEFEQTLALTEFTGPRPGLLQEKEQEQKPDISVTHDYFARPLKVIEEEQKGGQSRSKYSMDQDAVQKTARPGVPAGVGVRASSYMVEQTTPSEVGEQQANDDTKENPAGEQAKSDNNKKKVTQSATIDRAIIAPARVRYSVHAEKQQASPLPIRGSVASSSPVLDQHKEVARRAWRYFETNEQSNTGLFNGSNGYPNATVWDLGSGLAALIAAEQLGLIDQNRFGRSATQQLQTLAQIPLYNNVLPNREYNIQSGKMMDLQNRPSNVGSGWSAVDIGRILIWLKLAKEWYPELAGLVDKVVERWDLSLAVNSGELQGALFDGNEERRFQEGRLGYEHYAAIGFMLWGIDAPLALDVDNVAYVKINGIKVPYDERDHSYLTTDPFVLLVMEAGGLDERFRKMAETVYLVQKKRWQKEYILSAQGESRLAQEPWFVYNTIYANDTPWNTLSHGGRSYAEFSGGSTLIVFAWSALRRRDEYIDKLVDRVFNEFHPKFGYYSGFFQSGAPNTSIEVNTNAAILETLLYIKRHQAAFVVVSVETP